MTWEMVNLKDLCTVITKGTTPSNIGESFTDEGIKYIRSEMITSEKYISGEFLHISSDTHEKLKRSQLFEGDILFSMAGVYLGKTAILRKEDVPANTNQAVAIIRLDSNKCSREYIYYYLNRPDVVQTANKIQSQSAQPNINLRQIGELKIQFPDIQTQRRIADILSAYDDLIENNQKQIILLEEAAQRLYKEWFVDLRFPGCEHTRIIDGVPEGWERNRADKFYGITIGKTPSRAEEQWFTTDASETPWLSIADMKESTVFSDVTSERLTNDAIKRFNIVTVPPNTVVLSFKLTIGRVLISSESICTNEAIAHFHIDIPYHREYVYCYLKNFSYGTLGSTSSISTALNSKIVKSMPFIMPRNEILLRFSEQVKPIFDMIHSKILQNKELKQARDRLLPKLMNGEIKL